MSTIADAMREALYASTIRPDLTLLVLCHQKTIPSTAQHSNVITRSSGGLTLSLMRTPLIGVMTTQKMNRDWSARGLPGPRMDESRLDASHQISSHACQRVTMERLRVRASDFAKFTAHNTFSKEDEVTALFWQRNVRAATARGIHVVPEVGEIEGQIRECTRVEREAAAVSVHLPTNATAKDIARTINETLVEPMARSDTNAETTAHLEALSAPLKVRSIAESIGHEVQKLRGVQRENASIDRLEVETGRAVGKRNTQVFRRLLPLDRDDVLIELVGMVDGRFKDTDGIVEIKERRNRLFGRVVNYERVQMHCYMFLTETDTATLIERYDDQSAQYSVGKDEQFWDDCMARFNAFLDRQLSCPAPDQK